MNLSGFTSNSKVWVFQSDASLKEYEELISERLVVFLNQWKAHGKEVQAEFECCKEVFIVVVANERASSVSGCGIDALVKEIQSIQKDIGVNLFDRSKLYFETTVGLSSCSLFSVSDMISNGTVDKSWLMYDISVNSVESYLKRWKQPIKDSWVYRQLVLGEKPI